VFTEQISPVASAAISGNFKHCLGRVLIVNFVYTAYPNLSVM